MLFKTMGFMLCSHFLFLFLDSCQYADSGKFIPLELLEVLLFDLHSDNVQGGCDKANVT